MKLVKAQFCQSDGHHGKGFQYLLEKFTNEKSDAKLKAGVFVGPDIRDLMRDEKFDHGVGCLKIVQANDTQFSR